MKKVRCKNGGCASTVYPTVSMTILSCEGKILRRVNIMNEYARTGRDVIIRM